MMTSGWVLAVREIRENGGGGRGGDVRGPAGRRARLEVVWKAALATSRRTTWRDAERTGRAIDAMADNWPRGCGKFVLEGELVGGARFELGVTVTVTFGIAASG